jgi:ABC-type antimicrobial peptide transport system permease subunit
MLLCNTAALERWHLYSNYVNGQDTAGFLEYVRMFTIIGLLVLLIACINFINLTTARSEKRAKEVGVRKAIGSQRKDLVIQFLSEAFLYSFISSIVAVALVTLLLKGFSMIIDEPISFQTAFSPFIWSSLLALTIVVGLLAGSYPALYLTSFKPILVLKGTIQAGRASISRKVLVCCNSVVPLH